MPQLPDLPPRFECTYEHSCPYLEGLPTGWVLDRYRAVAGIERRYEEQLQALSQVLREERRARQKLERENKELQAQLQAVHRRQFKGRRSKAALPVPDAAAAPKKRGAPVGHPLWQRAAPTRIDQVVQVEAPRVCPHCQHAQLHPVRPLHEHVQEDIVLEPRTRVTCFRHRQAYCPRCDKPVWQPGAGEMPGAYIGPAAKATATYLRYQLNVPDRKISQFFNDFFGLRFVPASVCGFERQAVRRGRPLYEDLRQKVRTLPVVHADETSWRHDGQNYWVWYAGNNELALFQLDPHRTTHAAQSLLGARFGGILVADAFLAYKGLHPKDWQSCLAHIKTKAKALEQELALLKGKAADPRAREFCQQVQGFVRAACAAHHRLCAGRWRAKIAKQTAQGLQAQLNSLCDRPLRYPRAEAFRQRLRGAEQKHFFTCFRRPQVPPTNNQAERSLRPVVIMRKVILGTRSAKGLENHSVLRSLFETARRQGKKPHQFFLDLFTKNTLEAQAALYRKPLESRGKILQTAARKKPP